MATQFEIDCALMAGLAYQSTRDRINWFPAPAIWKEFSHVPNPAYAVTGGFEASSFQNIVTGDIVISFAGTAALNDWPANAGLALGGGSDQLLQAARYYCEVRAANPKANISFTGHSLGGGLAALLGVFFNRPAVTFDQAPFRNSATPQIRDALLTYLGNNGISGDVLLEGGEGDGEIHRVCGALSLSCNCPRTANTVAARRSIQYEYAGSVSRCMKEATTSLRHAGSHSRIVGRMADMDGNARGYWLAGRLPRVASGCGCVREREIPFAWKPWCRRMTHPAMNDLRGRNPA